MPPAVPGPDLPERSGRLSDTDGAPGPDGTDGHDDTNDDGHGAPRASWEDAYYRNLAARRTNPLSRAVGSWAQRLQDAAADGSFESQQPRYASGMTKRDYVLNTLGNATWGMVFPLLTIVATRLVGAADAGVFSLAFVTATLLMYVGDWGTRTFQVADRRDVRSFADYRAARLVSVAVMLAVGIAWHVLRGESPETLVMGIAVLAYRAQDSLADVFEGRLQQSDKTYLAGASQALRSAAALVLFSVVLLVSRNLAAASVALFVGALFVFVVFTVPMAALETPRPRKLDLANVIEILRVTSPMCAAFVLYNLCDNCPKLCMDGVLSPDNQLFFNAIYFPAHSILMMARMVYGPLIGTLADSRSGGDGSGGPKGSFSRLVAAIFACIVGLVAVMLVAMNTVGIPLMTFMYGIDFAGLRAAICLMIVAGGLTASTDFLYQVLTIERRQRMATPLYALTFVVSLVCSLVLIRLFALMGAVAAYVASMVFLFALLVWRTAVR